MKETDKRSAEVILNKTYYRINIQEILRDKINHKLINSSKDNDIMSKITKFCIIQHNETLYKEKNFFIPKTTDFNDYQKSTNPRKLE